MHSVPCGIWWSHDCRSQSYAISVHTTKNWSLDSLQPSSGSGTTVVRLSTISGTITEFIGATFHTGTSDAVHIHTHYTVGGKCIYHQHIMDAGSTLREFDAFK